MTGTQATLLWIYAAIIAIWPIRLLVAPGSSSPARHPARRRRRRFAGAEPPLVTAIIPAKDEEATLADCLASVCGQTYPHLEILVVDDRSTDRTGEIARDFAGADPRVRVITIDRPAARLDRQDPRPPAGRRPRRRATGSGSSTPTRCTRPTSSRS